MATIVQMPQMGVSDESALLAEWLVQEGEAVKVGQALFSQETGKSSFECLAEVDGTLLKQLVPAGEEVKVGTPVAVIGQPGEKFDLPAGAAAPAAEAPKAEAPKAEAAAPAAAAPAAAAPAPAATAAAPAAGDHLNASPRAKNLAADLGVDVAQATPTGPEGRIIERDVKALAANGAAAAPKAEAAAPAPAAAPAAPAAAYEDQPITRIRKVIAENMHSSLATMAQLTLNRTFDATAIVELRKRMKASEGYGLEKVTINDFILLAVARTLPEFPDINANFLDGKTMRRFAHAQLGCAVDTPRGLFVPVMHDADKMSLRDISKWVKAKAAACKDGAITPAELAGGSFTVSNLGAQGVESFTPIINPPQTAILGVCGLTLRPRETADGEVEFYQAMGLSLTFDHRVVDGAPAAKFLKTLAERLENIEFLMAM
jgi:pyruvate dehydrogenase E2 component (dihydrolipoamide acetyltransferase)